MLKAELPRFFKDARFNPDNMTWFAGLHENTDNRHIHISFFENVPLRIRAHKNERQFSHGKINPTCIDRFKLRVEQRLTNVAAELKIARAELSTISKDVLFSKENTLKYNGEF